MGRVASSLSIVFPMWNEESSIHLAVDAAREAAASLVAAGDIDNYQVVIVNDASTDATGRLADEMAAHDERIVVQHHRHNLGLGGSIKTGLAAATGELVLYTDADLARLNRAVHAAEDEGSFRTFLEADRALHLGIARVARNGFLSEAAGRILTLNAWLWHAQMARYGIAADDYASHDPIVAAIERRDPAGARAAMADHIERSRELLRVTL